MASAYDVIVIGAGVNGLVAAAALAQAGQRVLVLEANEASGGQARTVEFAPGFRTVPLGNEACWVPPAVVKTLGIQLERVECATPLTNFVHPGEFLTLHANPSKAADAIRRYSSADAARWPAFTTLLHKLAAFLGALYQLPAPAIDTSAPAELLALLGLGRKARALGRADMIELLRVLPMSIEELADDTFESAELKVAVVAGGVRNLQQGPRSGGTSFNLLHYLTAAPVGSVRNAGWWRSGADAFVRAAETVARKLGATIRPNAPVARITVKDDAVTGVVLADGTEIPARRVLSTADPKRTVGLIDPVWLDPEFLHAIRHIKMRGCTAYVLYALDALPDFTGLDAGALRGFVSLSTAYPGFSVIEGAANAAKYGQLSQRPHIELTVPTLRWPDAQLAPTGQHVLVATAQYAPYNLKGARWSAALRESFADRVTDWIEAAAPCFRSRVLQRVTLAPPELEHHYGLTEGALTHGEMMLDQILFMRPVGGYGRYRLPIDGLYIGGAGTHPGPGVLGGPGWLAATQMLHDTNSK
jgi:phytoene dehydrogenase-like protein